MKRPTRLVIVAVIALVVCFVALGLTARWWADSLEREARAGKAQAVAGAQSLAAQEATAAATQFAEASRAFGRAEALLGPDWLESVARKLPLVARHYDAAQALIEIGTGASTAGTELAAVLQGTSGQGGSEAAEASSLSAERQRHVDAALAALTDVADEASRLEEDGLAEPLATEVRSLKSALREIPYLDRAEPLLKLVRAFRKSEQRILVLSQSSAELRPTGGFIGSFGVLKVGPDGVELESYKDVYTLPDPPGRVPRPVGARMTHDFQFRDSNWWMDFPTSAEQALEFWGDCEQPPVDGIIAVDIPAMRSLIEVFGPIEVPGFSETFSADNLIERLHYLTEVKSTGPGRKDVLVGLAHEVEERTLNAGPRELPKVALALANAADEKHVQMFFTDPEMQAAAAQLGWSGAVAPLADTTDFLAVSNAMSKASKANYAMSKTIDYGVTLEPDGSAETMLTLGYANTGRLVIPEHGVFRNYLRIYRAPGTVRPDGTAPEDLDERYPDVDLPVFDRQFLVRRDRTREQAFESRVPRAWRAEGAEASYRLQIVRQPDLEDIPTTVSVTPPPGWRVSGAKAWEVASGDEVAATIADGVAMLEVPLSADLVLDVQLERE